MRMDHYMKFGDNNIHLANILYTLMTIAILFTIVSACLYRAIGNDFKAIELIASKRRAKRDERRNRDAGEDEIGLNSNKPKVQAEDVAWKKLQGDVFRKPELSALFCVMLGIGLQVFIYIIVVLLFLTLGIISPTGRVWYYFQGFLYMCIGGCGNGFCTAKAIKYFGSGEWRFAASAAAFVLPMYIISTFLMVDIIEWFEKSDQIMPFGSMLLFCFAWVFVNVPFTYYGAY